MVGKGLVQHVVICFWRLCRLGARHVSDSPRLGLPRGLWPRYSTIQAPTGPTLRSALQRELCRPRPPQLPTSRPLQGIERRQREEWGGRWQHRLPNEDGSVVLRDVASEVGGVVQLLMQSAEPAKGWMLHRQVAAGREIGVIPAVGMYQYRCLLARLLRTDLLCSPRTVAVCATASFRRGGGLRSDMATWDYAITGGQVVRSTGTNV
jgi:hypothetical protein